MGNARCRKAPVEESFERWLATEAPLFYRLAGQQGAPPEDVEDLIQDLLLKAWILQEEILDLRSWMFVAFRNRLARDGKRKRRRRELIRDSGSALEPAVRAGLADSLALREAIGELSPRARRYVTYRYVVGLSETEAAIRAGYSPASAKKAGTRSLALLRRVLSESANASGAGE
jgi:RNA polymerase sigma factor (sigma-70 family)